MRHFFISIFCSLFLLTAATAQKNRQVKAVVTELKEHQPLADATVVLFREKDTLPYDNTLTNAEGLFQFKRLDNGRYTVLITATGHVPLKKDFELNATGTTLPDSLYMIIAYKQEDTVTVRGLVIPMVVKKDTLEFNPAAFKTPEDEAIEELIKKIPGFELDTDGSLKYNGEEVKQIMVDGKPFALDPNLPITKILPVHVIDKIQLIDQRPKDQKYNKNDDGVREKVLNLTIKKNKKRGWIGRASVSKGSNNLLNGSGNLSRFNNERKLLTNFSGGNTGQTNSGQGFSGGQINAGRNRNFSAGAGYQDSWKKGSQLSMNGGFNSNTSENANNSVRTTFLPGDTSLIAQNQSQSSNSNQGKNFSVQYNNEPDEHQNLSFDASYFSSTGNSFRKASTITNNNFKAPVNTYSNSTTGENKSEQLSLNVSYNRELDTMGRSFSIRAAWQSSKNNSDQFATTQNIFFENNGNIKRKDSLDQERKSTGNSGNRQLFFNYNSPLFKKFFLNLSYGLQWSESRSLINVYDRDHSTDEYELFNDSLSNGFSNHTLTHNASFSIGHGKNGLNYSLRLGVRRQVNENKNYDSVNVMQQRFLNFTPAFNINYFKKDRPSVRFSYSGQTNQPSVLQRQPVIDNTHPLYLRLGNPDLRPEYNNQVSLNINRTYVRSGINYSANMSFNNTFNKITESVSFNSEGKQVTQPVNLSGAYSASLWSSFGYPISKRKKHSGGVSLNLRRGKSVSLVNNQRNMGRDLSVGSGLTFNAGVEKWLDVNGGVNYNYSETIYQSATRGNIIYNYMSANIRTTFRIPGEWEILSQLDYVNRGTKVQYGRETTIWNMGVNKKLFKKKIVCGFRIQDLLKQQISYSRNIGVNYIEESKNAVIGRYYMFTVSYQLNKFGGKEPPKKN